MFFLFKSEALIDLCSLTSLDGYTTIDQRDKECKYKTDDGSADPTEQEPLKVKSTSDLIQDSGHGRLNNDFMWKNTVTFFLSVFLWLPLCDFCGGLSLEALNVIDSVKRLRLVVLFLLPQSQIWEPAVN